MIAPYFYANYLFHYSIEERKRKDARTKIPLSNRMERGGAMAGRLNWIPAGSCGVIVKARKSPRLQAIGLVPGAEVRCKYKSQGTMVLEIGNRWIALRRRALRGVWVDY